MAKKICKKCGHPQELREDRSAKTSWACSDCGHRNKLKIIALIALVALISIPIAYGEIDPTNVPFPSPWMKDCTYSVDEFLIFNCIWRSDRIPDEVKDKLANLENKTDILPPDEYEASKTRIIIDWLTTPPPETIPEPEPPKPTVRDILITKLDPGLKEAIEQLAECQYGYDGWEAIQQQTFYEIPDQMIAFDGKIRNEVLIKRLNMAFQACYWQEKYPLSAMYQNFVDADLLGLDRFNRTATQFFNQTTDFTRGSEIYAPLTQADFDNATKQATDWLKTAPYIDPNLGCVPRDETDTRCQARGNPEPIVKDARGYADYVNFKAGQVLTAQDFINLEVKLKELQCIAHYPIYKHRTGREGGAELPVWLEHCESIENEFDRIGYACYTGGEQVLCSDLRKMQEAKGN